jgi:hypothetical protein
MRKKRGVSPFFSGSSGICLEGHLLAIDPVVTLGQGELRPQGQQTERKRREWLSSNHSIPQLNWLGAC